MMTLIFCSAKPHEASTRPKAASDFRPVAPEGVGSRMDAL